MAISDISDILFCIKIHAIHSIRVRAHTNFAKFSVIIKRMLREYQLFTFAPHVRCVFILLINPCPGRWLDFYRCGDDDDADRHGEGKHCLQQLPRRYACFRLPVPSCSHTCICTCRSFCENFVSINECIRESIL